MPSFIVESVEASPEMILTLAFKGRMVVDRFMELIDANRYIRNAIQVYFYVIPAMIVLVYLFLDVVVRITTLN